MANLSPASVTINILPVTLSLVHIPRSRLTELSRPILKQVLRKSPNFLNLTANEIELSIFAEDTEVQDFEPIARRDRQKQRLRDQASSKSRSTTGGHRHARSSRDHDALQPVEISFEKWKVLQIDSHEDSLSNSGSRVRELSAPLAAAGISILYQSSYMSDFIFVKASRLESVMALLGEAGFSMYNSDPHDIDSPSYFDHRLSSPDVQIFSQRQDESFGHGVSLPGTPGTMSPHPQNNTVLSRTRSPSVASLTALSLAISRGGTFEDLPEAAMAITQNSAAFFTSGSATSFSVRTPKKSMSPTSAPVEVLSPDLACVGLSETAADYWSIKILTLVGYPELIPASDPTLSPPQPTQHPNVQNSIYASATSHPRVRRASPALGGFSSDIGGFDSTLEDPILSKRFSRLGRPLDDPFSQDSSSPTSLSSCSSSDDDEAYFSSSSPYNRTRNGLDGGSTPSLVSTASRSSARSLPEPLELHRLRSERPTLSRLPTLTAVHSLQPPSTIRPPVGLEGGGRARGRSAAKSPDAVSPRVPFFSFTRTSEGSSLTTDLRVLAALFARDERHMIICQGELLDAGDALNENALDDERARGDIHNSQMFDLDGEDGLFEMDAEVEEEESAPGTMKCLQIDLQKFGLEKHGLVNRFSRVLEENGINHMYSSTYKTANLLVDKANAVRAKSLLRSC